MVTLATLQTQVRRWCNEPGSLGSVTDAELIDWLNDAQRIVYQDIVQLDRGTLRASAALALTASTAEYDLTTVADRKITEVLLTYETYLSRLRFVRFRDIPRGQVPTVNQRPTIYYLRGSFIGIYPPPATTGTLTVHYIPAMTALAQASDVALAPDEYQDFYVASAARQLYLKLGNDRRAAEMQQRAAEARRNFIESFGPRHIDEPEVIHYVGEFDDPFPDW